MKVLVALMAAVFVLAAGTSFAFGDCAGHNKAQMVKAPAQEQVSKDQPTSTPLTVAEKADLAKPAAKTADAKK
jgi:hypothetical protein